MSRIGHSARDHLRPRAIIVTFTPGLLALVIVVLARLLGGVPIDVMLHEPTAVGGVAPYAGFVAQLGTIGWAAAAGAFLVGAMLMRGVDRRVRRFFLASAALTLYLCLDDTYLLHEEMLPGIGIPEYLVYAVIGVAALAYVTAFRRELLGGAVSFALLAGGLLAFSVLIDVVDQSLNLPLGYFVIALLEDGAKLLGISAWLTFAVLTTRECVRATLVKHTPTAPLQDVGARSVAH